MTKGACKEVGIDIKDIKNYITVRQAKNLVQQYLIYKHGDLIINKNIMQKIHSELCDWIHGVELAKLSANDELSCYWDDKKNTMIFINSK